MVSMATEIMSADPNYPMLLITRSSGPYLFGTCSCGTWHTGERLRTALIAEEWDEHMLRSEEHRALREELLAANQRRRAARSAV
jgi:hypothetical protein